MNEPPGARARVCLTGLTVAEYFRDQEGQDVLLFIDNIFRFTQAGSEVRKLCMLELGGRGGKGRGGRDRRRGEERRGEGKREEGRGGREEEKWRGG